MLFSDIPNWLCWRLEKRAGKNTKIPYTPQGRPASSTDEATWSSYEEVKKVADGKKFTGIGFALPTDATILAVDIDKCLDDQKDIIKDIFKKFVKEANTYTEISPSGTGLHLFFRVPEGYHPEANRSSKQPGFELYSTGRYMTMTGNVYQNITEHQDARSISPAELDALLSTVGYPWKLLSDNKSTKDISPLTLDDQEIKRRMFAAKNGKEVEALWNGDTSKYDGDDSAADFGLCMHLAFWTQKDKNRMLSLWLSSPLGQREKTKKRKDYQDATVSHAASMQQDMYSPNAAEEVARALDLMTNPKGVPFRNAENTRRIIAQDALLSASFRHNAFTKTDETNLGGEWTSIQNNHVIFAMMHIQKTYPFFESITKGITEDAIVAHAYMKKVNPPRDWILSLEWDGTHRLDHWLHVVYGVDDDAYHSAVGANWMKGLVKRIVSPGCKFDFLLILESPQGWRKSSSLAILGRGLHVETTMSVDNKDFYMLMARNTIVEFSEGHTMNRSDTRLLKSIITTQEDQFRAPYGRDIVFHPRHCVFAMTTNQNTYLRDETGNRRFLPVVVKNPADIVWLTDNLSQLYAEAYKRAVVDNETTWEFPEEETKAIQESKVVEDPYEEALVEWYVNLPSDTREKGITPKMAYQAVWQGNVPMGREMTMGNVLQVTTLFSHQLFLEKKKAYLNGSRSMRWFATKKTQDIFDARVDTMTDTEKLFIERF